MKGKHFIVAALVLLTMGGLEAQTPTKRPNRQYSKQDSTIYLESVEVIGQKKNPSSLTRANVSLDKLPVTLSTIKADQLTKHAIFDVKEAVRFIPGANMRTSYGAFQQLSVRGFDHTPVMVDGMRDERSGISNSYPLSDLSDVASIELLKGPASVLQGHSTVGGVLNITRKDLSSRRHLYSRLSLGSFERRQATLGFGGEMFNPINYYIGVNYADGQGWRSRGDRRFKTYGAIGSKWGNSSLQFRGGYSRDFYGTEIGLPPTLNETVFHKDGSQYLAPGQVQPGLNRANRYNNASDFMFNENWNISAKYVYNFEGDMRLTEHVSYNDDLIDYFGTEELSYRTSDKSIYPYYVMRDDKKVYIDMDSVQLTYPLRFAHRAKTVQNQLTLDGSFYTGAIKHNYNAGYAFSFMRRVSFSGYSLGKDVVGPGLYSVTSVHNPRSMGYMDSSFSRATPRRTFTHGIYLQDVVEFSEQFQAMAAVRYDYYHFESASAKTIGGKREFVDPAGKDYKKTLSQAVTYRVGAVYSPVKEVNVYASLANFYQPYRNFFNDYTIYVNSEGKEFFPKVDGEVFKPKTGYQAELGTRIQLNHIFSTQVAGYYIKQNNITKFLGEQEVEENGKKVTKDIVGQVGTIDSKGFEIELTATPIRGLFLTAGYSLTDAKYSKLNKNKYLDSDVHEGDPLIYIPKHKFYSYGDYQVQKGDLRGLDFHYSFSYTGKMYRNYKKNLFFEAYTLLNLGVSCPIYKDLKLSVDVNNVLNSQFYAQSLGRQLVPNEPTSFMMSLTYKL